MNSEHRFSNLRERKHWSDHFFFFFFFKISLHSLEIKDFITANQNWVSSLSVILLASLYAAFDWMYGNISSVTFRMAPNSAVILLSAVVLFCVASALPRHSSTNREDPTGNPFFVDFNPLWLLGRWGNQVVSIYIETKVCVQKYELRWVFFFFFFFFK